MFSTPFAFLAQSNSVPYDTDAQAYIDAVIAAGGSLDSTQQDAVNALFVGLKDDGIYSSLYAFYPIVGGVEDAHKINANLDASYDLTYYGGWTHDAGGQTPDGIAGTYADTAYVIPANAYSNSFGIYVTDDSWVNGYASDMGCTDGSSYFWLASFWPGENAARYWNLNGNVFYNSPPSSGFLVNSRTAVDLWENYFNGTLVSTDTSTATGNGTMPPIALGGIKYPSSIEFSSSRNQIFAFMAQGLTLAEVGNLYTIVNAFQTSLGRNTY